MNLDQWKSRLGWLAMVTAILVCSPLAEARQRERQANDDLQLTVVDQDTAATVVVDADPPKTRPWLGLHCFPANETLRAHVKLPEGQGLVVGSVADDSPAMKAGIQANDILLKAADQALKDVPDLVKALENTGDKPLAIELLRGGETKTIEVTPAQRPATAVEPAATPDRDVVRHWMDRVREVAPIIEGLPERIRFFRPGIPVLAPFPKDLHLTITKDGDTPAKIVVKKGDEQWEVTEDQLAELPEQVRGHVETFLGKLPTGEFMIDVVPHDEAEAGGREEGEKRGIRDRDGAGRPRDAESRARRATEEATRRVAEAERRLREQAGPQVERFGRRLEQLEQQLQERFEKLERLIDERIKAIEAPPAESSKPAKPDQSESGPTLPAPTDT